VRAGLRTNHHRVAEAHVDAVSNSTTSRLLMSTLMWYGRLQFWLVFTNNGLIVRCCQESSRDCRSQRGIYTYTQHTYTCARSTFDDIHIKTHPLIMRMMSRFAGVAYDERRRREESGHGARAIRCSQLGRRSDGCRVCCSLLVCSTTLGYSAPNRSSPRNAPAAYWRQSRASLNRN
jgi:hypothetical protein